MLAFTISYHCILLSLYSFNPYCDISVYFWPLCHDEAVSSSINEKLHEEICSLCSFDFAISFCH